MRASIEIIDELVCARVPALPHIRESAPFSSANCDREIDKGPSACLWDLSLPQLQLAGLVTARQHFTNDAPTADSTLHDNTIGYCRLRSDAHYRELAEATL